MSLASYQAAPPRDSVLMDQKSDRMSLNLLGVESHRLFPRARDAAYYRRTRRMPVTFFLNHRLKMVFQIRSLTYVMVWKTTRVVKASPHNPFHELNGRTNQAFLVARSSRSFAPLRFATSSLLPSAFTFTPTRVGLLVSGQINCTLEASMANSVWRRPPCGLFG